MFDIVSETFIKEYFFLRAVLADYADKRALFNMLVELFYISQPQAEALFELSENKAVADLKTQEDCKRYNRVKQYHAMCGNPVDETEVEWIIDVKSNAITFAAEKNLCADNSSTRTHIYETLLAEANFGKVAAMRVLGLLQCEGVCFDKQYDAGLKYLRRAAQWGDIVSLLAMIKYSKDDEVTLTKQLSRLSEAVRGTQYEGLLASALTANNVAEIKPSEELALLKRAFSVKRAKTDIYEPLCARLVYSTTISLKDREKSLFSETKGMLSEVCDLPLKLTSGTISLNTQSIENLPLHRESEQDRLLTALYNVDLRTLESYRPICLSVGNSYLLEMYANAIVNMKQTDTTNFDRIEVADLHSYEFEPSNNNVFVRCCVDEVDNILVFVLRGEIDSHTLQHVKNFLKTGKRRQFHLNNPRVTLDLSSVLPICVCDSANAQKLSELVDVVEIADIKAEEKRDILLAMTEQKSKSYFAFNVQLDDDVVNTLCSCALDTADKVLDRIFSERRPDKSFNCVTAEVLQPYLKLIKGNNDRPYGFGGYNK